MTHQHPNAHHLLCLQYAEGIRTIRLHKDSYRVGRDRQNEIVILDALISRFHATLIRVLVPEINDYRYRVVDGDSDGNPSKNGIYINQNLSRSQVLENGDLIAFANIYASYHIQSVGKGMDEDGEEEVSKSFKADALLPKDRYPTNPGLSIEDHLLEEADCPPTATFLSNFAVNPRPHKIRSKASLTCVEN